MRTGQISTATTSGYTSELVTLLLPYLWEGSIPNGIASPYEADPDMPRGSADPSHTGTWMAMVADVRTAWEEPVLTPTERRRLLRFSILGGEHGHINDGTHRRSAYGLLAEWEGASRSAVQASVEAAASKLADVANGLDREGFG
ncbi:hypothetical protein [Puerhibacterium puerhi]|uniref:hypothetical protein n=1 Tax=Puerhibacterium puerhi TaxID=2692623 RepID=UPI0013589741|nr:hypothetical protein [Puerhibacterium puerhi]